MTKQPVTAMDKGQLEDIVSRLGRRQRDHRRDKENVRNVMTLYDSIRLYK